MKNLYDRLSPENQDKLKQISELYPATFSAVSEELRANKSYLGLTYYTICELVNHFGLKDYSPFSMNEIFNN